MMVLQIMLVAGGWDGTKFLSSTEVLTTDSDTWTMSTPLPMAATGFKGVTVENSFYITGIIIMNGDLHDNKCFRWLG